MSGTFNEQQARIDALLSSANTRASNTQRLQNLAKLGIESPMALSPAEIQQMCYVASAHFRIFTIRSLG
jgi:hypothetical protein